MVTARTAKILANIPGLVAREDGIVLAKMAASVPADQAIVEIGAHRGLSTCWLAAGSKEDGAGALVTSIDPWPLAGVAEDFREDVVWAEEGAMEQHARNLAKVGVSEIVTAVRGTAVDVAASWPGTPIGMLFHDADHSYEAVKDDYLAWLPYLVPGCWVAVHDYFGAVPDDKGGWRRVDVIQAAVKHVLLASGEWTDVRIIGTHDGDARQSPNLWVGRRW
jgi:predicted O-methyltransferase YrrM